jgi:transaldolase
VQIFLDTANIKDIEYWNETGMVDGITTNPTIIAKSGADFFTVIRDICKIIKGPVSAEVIATEACLMVDEGLKLADIAPNVVVKLPITRDGLIACSKLASRDIKVNMTLCFSVTQSIMAAKAGAYFISPFVGRLDDIASDGMGLVADTREVYDNYGFTTQVLAASIRNLQHVIEAARIAADAITIPPAILVQMLSHPLTDKGLEIFLKDWNKAN